MAKRLRWITRVAGERAEDLRVLVPYGETWRTGANEAHYFRDHADVMVGGTHVPAGSYTIFTISQQGQMDADHQQENRRVGHRLSRSGKRFGAYRDEGIALPAAAENFTIAFDKFLRRMRSPDRLGDDAGLRGNWQDVAAKDFKKKSGQIGMSVPPISLFWCESRLGIRRESAYCDGSRQAWRW